ncbi:MAG: hypothetical protein KDA85_20065 [Planctomycetaceae bacterium]|nr:hypothetical protein [Planctomycetaceae bacterium]
MLSASSMLRLLKICGVLLLLSNTSLPLNAADEEKPIEPAAVNLGRPVDFDGDVYPILQANCVACHNSTTAESDLIVESAESMLKGGSLGPAIVPGKPDESVLFQVCARTGEPFMPPLPNDRNAKSLSPEQLGLLKQWILEGAKGGLGRSAASMKWQPINPRLQGVFSVDVDPFGRFVAAGRGAEVTVYDLRAGARSVQLDDPSLHAADGSPQRKVAHRDFVHSIAMHPSGNLLATSGYQVVKLWERQQAPSSVALPEGTTLSAVAANGSVVVSATAAAGISVTRTQDAQVVASIPTDGQAVVALGISADGSRVVAGLADGRVQQTLVATPDVAIRSEALSAPAVRIVCGAAADSRIAVLSQDGALRLLAVSGDPAALTVAGEIASKASEQPILVANGNQVATVVDRTVRICSLQDGAVQKEFAAPDDVVSLAIHEAAARAVVVLKNGQALLWSVAEPKQLAALTQDLTAARALASAEHEKGLRDARVGVLKNQVDAGEKDLTAQKEAEAKTVTELEAAAKAQEEATTKHTEAAAATAAAKKALEEKPDDEAAKKAVTDAEAAETKAKEALTDAESKHQIAIKSKQFAAQAVERSQQRLEEKKGLHAEATTRAEAAVQVVEAARPAAAAAVTATGGAIIADGSLVATCDAAGNCRLWSAVDGAAVDVLASGMPEGGAPPTSQFAADQLWVNATSGLTGIALLPTWQLRHTLGPDASGKSVFVDRVLSLAFSPDGKLLAAGGGEASRSGQLNLWDVEQGTLVREIPDAHSDTVYGIEFSPDGELLASAGADKFVRVFTVANGEFVRAFEGHTHHVMDVSWKSDRTTLVSAGADNAIKVWDAETGEQSRTITTYTRQVTSLQFLDLQDDFVSSSGDKRVFLHRAANGGTVREFKGCPDYVYRAVATPDGKTVVAGCEDGLVRVWNGADAKELAALTPVQ